MVKLWEQTAVVTRLSERLEFRHNFDKISDNLLTIWHHWHQPYNGCVCMCVYAWYVNRWLNDCRFESCQFGKPKKPGQALTGALTVPLQLDRVPMSLFSDGPVFPEV